MSTREVRMVTAAVGAAEARPEGIATRPGAAQLTLAIVVSVNFMVLLDVSILNVAIPSIQRGLSASYAQMQLVLAAYLLGYGALLITGGRLGDLYGRKRLFLTGLAGFLGASALCGAVPSAPMLIAGRALQGVFAALAFPQVFSIIQVTFPPERRASVFGVVGAVMGLAAVVGALAGALLLKLDVLGLGWRSLFFVNLVVGVPALALAWRRLPESRAAGAGRLDVPGVIAATAGLGLIVVPLILGREAGWPLWAFVALAASVPVLAGFVRYEWRKTRRDASPLVVMTLFFDRAFVGGIAMAFTLFAAVFSFFFVITLYLQFGEGFSGAATGLTVAPFATGVLIASIGSPRLARRIGRRILRLGAAALACGMAGIALVSWLQGPAGLDGYELALPLLAGGLGYGCILAPLLSIMLAGVRSQAVGSASGVYTTAQQIGGSVGVALIGVIFFRLLARPDLTAAGGAGGRLLFSQALSIALLFNTGLAIALYFLAGLLPAPRPPGPQPG